MSQQGETAAAHEDDWWRRLYDETARDAGASDAGDSLDDRFDSASGAVGSGGHGGNGAGAGEPEATPSSELLPSPDLPPGASATEGASAAEGASVTVPSPSRRSVAERPVTPRTTDVPQASVVPQGPVAPQASVVPQGRIAPRTPATTVTAPAQAPSPARGPESEPDREPVPAPRPVIGHVGDRPPTYDAEPTALPVAVPQELDGLVADTVLDGARYGTYTLRAASVRGDSARFRGDPRRDALLTVRFGTDRNALVLVAVATGARGTGRAHLAAADACRWIGGAVGRSHSRLSEDIRAGRRDDLKSGLHRLTDRGYGKLRARAAELGLEPREYTADLRCLLLPADPDCRTRIFFGIGAGGLFRLRDGVWQDLEPEVPDSGGAGGVAGEAMVGLGPLPSVSGPRWGSGSGPGGVRGGDPGGEGLTMDPETTAHPTYAESPLPSPGEPFRFRASVARPGDTLLLCSTGLAEPLRGEPALARELAERWSGDQAPGLATFLADAQLRVKGYSDDRTSVGVWEA
ncbi:protein phosphatase 2C domain-containing protein [Streptomyces sp. NPDC047515]|uniref:protein phosphatase 2C domain-containing protein n=1 Tax=Streptomyces sp. NPDC047515 TaxID=3155380 RepID=UPI0033CC4D32